MIAVLFRNPLLRAVFRLWWLPAVGVTLAWAARGDHDFRVVSLGLASALAAFAGLVGAAWLVDRSLQRRAEAERRRREHRFLCPTCLCWDSFRFACAACGSEVPRAVVHTRGACVNDCARCHAPIFPPERAENPRLHAYCARCWGCFDPVRYHGRRVQVLGTLFKADLTAICDTISSSPKPGNGTVCVWDDGLRLTYVLPLNDLTDQGRELPRSHAVRAVTAIWLDGADVEPLALGQVVDRFILQTGCTEEQLRSVAVHVRQEALPTAAHHLLASRFGAVRYGIDAHALLTRRSSGWDLAPLPPSHLVSSAAPPEKAARRRTPDALMEGVTAPPSPSSGAVLPTNAGKPPQPPNNGGSIGAGQRRSPHYWGAGGAGPGSASGSTGSREAGVNPASNRDSDRLRRGSKTRRARVR